MWSYLGWRKGYVYYLFHRVGFRDYDHTLNLIETEMRGLTIFFPSLSCWVVGILGMFCQNMEIVYKEL